MNPFNTFVTKLIVKESRNVFQIEIHRFYCPYRIILTNMNSLLYFTVLKLKNIRGLSRIFRGIFPLSRERYYEATH